MKITLFYIISYTVRMLQKHSFWMESIERFLLKVILLQCLIDKASKQVTAALNRCVVISIVYLCCFIITDCCVTPSTNLGLDHESSACTNWLDHDDVWRHGLQMTTSSSSSASGGLNSAFVSYCLCIANVK